MSQHATTARPLPRRQVAPARPPLRALPTVRPGGNAAFAALCSILLIAGLLGVLVLNTSITQASFTVHKLQEESRGLDARIATLTQDLGAAESANTLASKAVEMGMVRPNQMAFIDLGSGAITGVAYPANVDRNLTLVASPVKPPPLPDLSAVNKVTAPEPKPVIPPEPAPAPAAPAAVPQPPAAPQPAPAQPPAPTPAQPPAPTR